METLFYFTISFIGLGLYASIIWYVKYYQFKSDGQILKGVIIKKIYKPAEFSEQTPAYQFLVRFMPSYHKNKTSKVTLVSKKIFYQKNIGQEIIIYDHYKWKTVKNQLMIKDLHDLTSIKVLLIVLAILIVLAVYLFIKAF